MTPQRVWLSIAMTALCAGLSAQTMPVTSLKTTAEATDFKSTSSYGDVVAFMKAVDAASPLVFYTTYGKTFEGRDMPMAVVGTGLRDASAASVKASGRLRVHIQGNIHAGEVEGKESAQVLLRDFAAGRHADWLQSTVFLITPIFNADGNEKMSLTSRLPQNGPINGQGTRANAQNMNINRDFTRLDTPEAKAFAALWTDYDPHVGIDLHTSDGSFHAYHLTYSPPLHPNTNAGISALLREQWFPSVTKQIRDAHGWDTFYYGNASNLPAGSPAARAWSTFEHVARFHNNYVGMRNRFALLSEAYSYLTFEDRIKATNAFLDASLTYAHQHAAEIRRLDEAADQEVLIGKTLATRARIKTGGVISILMGEVEGVKHPTTGQNMYLRKDVSKAEPMVDRLWFEPTLTEEVPQEFFVPAAAVKAIALLQAHGIQTRPTTSVVGAGVEQFVITSNTARPPSASPDFGGHGVRTLEGQWEVMRSAPAQDSAWIAVPMNQPLARLAFDLLAPTSDDGVVFWNVLDDQLNGATVYPILRRK